MKKMLLIILDGFGVRKEEKGNAIKQANMPTYTKLWNEYPHALLEASGKAIGLNNGEVGSSKFGHLTIGAGRLIKKDSSQIEEMFEKNELRKNEVYNEMINYSKDNNRPIHLLVSLADDVNNTFKIIEKLNADKIRKVYVHVITDRYNNDNHSSSKYIKQINEKLDEYNIGHVVSICGKYYALDTDENWKKTKYYSDMITLGSGVNVSDIDDAIKLCYKKDISDEYIPPLLIDDKHIIRDGDALLLFNTKSNDARQLLNVLTNEEFDKYPVLSLPNLKVYSLYEVDDGLKCKNILKRQELTNSLGEYLSNLGLTQARIAETIKYDHVTKYFDGDRILELNGCDKFLISTHKVLKPEMSSKEITKRVVKCINKNYDFILVNYANADMLAHTKNFKSTIEALEAIDNSLGTIMEYAEENFYTVAITSDHGYAENMIDENNNMTLSHSIYPVPFIITDNKIKLRNGTLISVAPTILKYMDIKIPEEMKKASLLIEE